MNPIRCLAQRNRQRALARVGRGVSPWLLAFLSIGYGSMLPEPATASRNEILAVREWEGRLTATASGTLSESGEHCRITLHLEGEFELGDFDPLLLRWEGKFTGSRARYHEVCRTEADGLVSDSVVQGDGPVAASEGWQLELTLNEFNDDYVFNWGASLQTHTRSTMSLPGMSETSDSDDERHLASGRDRVPPPAEGVILRQSRSSDARGEGGSDFSFDPDTFDNLGKWSFEYTIEPKREHNLKLEVQSDEYKRWRPEAESGPKAGKPIEFTASLLDGDGELSDAAVLKYEWKLIDTSREPGIAINWPRDAKDKDFDMKFEPGAKQQVTDGTGQQMVGLTQGPQEAARILAYDWGAWSTLSVTVYLHDGRKVTGKLKAEGEPETESIRLPWRDEGSFTSKAWKLDRGVDGGDSSDDDATPAGDGTNGDGLSLYEEYRGFYEDGQHREGDPEKKEYFAMAEGNARAVASSGLSLFERLSELEVHDELRPEELSTAKVINSNHSASPRLGDQHGVIIKIDPAMKNYARAKSIAGTGPSSPKGIDYLGLPPVIHPRPTSDNSADYAASMVAHELFHTVNVWHHGDNADLVVAWERGADGVLYEREAEVDENDQCLPMGPGRAIRALLESGEDVTDSPMLKLGCRTLGVRGGPHSGYENCVMRYDISRGYESRSDGNVRYALKMEPTGTKLCDTPNGVDFNDPSKGAPLPRYGSAQQGRGNCKGQIHVTDIVPAPRR